MPLATSMSGPTILAIFWIGCLGRSSGDTNRLMALNWMPPRQRCSTAIRLCVLPPPKLVSSRMIGAFESFTPLNLPRVSRSSDFSPPVGYVFAKNLDGSPYTSSASPRKTLVSEAANCCSRNSPFSTSSRGMQVSKIVFKDVVLNLYSEGSFGDTIGTQRSSLDRPKVANINFGTLVGD